MAAELRAAMGRCTATTYLAAATRADTSVTLAPIMLPLTACDEGNVEITYSG